MRFPDNSLEDLAANKETDLKYIVHSRTTEVLNEFYYKVKVIFEYDSKFYSFTAVGDDCVCLVLRERYPDKTIEIAEASASDLKIIGKDQPL